MAVHGWGEISNQFPVSPINGAVVSAFLKGVVDIRWDNPALLASNTNYRIAGVNIYRSDISEYGPYHRINDFPISGQFYRDATDNVPVTEIVNWDTGWIFKGEPEYGKKWILRTQAIAVKDITYDCVFADSQSDVKVFINGNQVEVIDVFGRNGQITIKSVDDFDYIKGTNTKVILPSTTDEVIVQYFTSRNLVKCGLDEKVFYRLTSVGYSEYSPTGFVETPLDYCEPLSLTKVENMDWIWREAVRRNNWILEQGGERVKLFIRKTSGQLCNCQGLDAREAEYNQQPRNDCAYCFGTGYIGGYEGPWEIILAPDDAPRKVEQTERGMHLNHLYDVWTGPTPLITQRDFIVKQTNERYSIGPVHKPTNRGNILQQHFPLQFFDESDIRYKVPIDGTDILLWPQSRVTVDPRECAIVYPLAEYGPIHPLTPDEHSPQIHPVNSSPYSTTPMNTEKSNIPDSREIRGRTQTFENQNY